MDDSTTVGVLKKAGCKFRDEREWGKFHNPKDLSVDLIIEAAELLERFRFKSEKEISALLSNPQKRGEISDEMGDVLLALVLLSDCCQIDMSEAFFKKLEKTSRRYPAGLVKGKNKKYDEY